MYITTYVTIAYALVLLLGGFIGYVTAGSLASLLTATFFAIAFLGLSIRLRKSCPFSKYGIIALAFSLFIFFSARFLLSYKIMPAGMMALLSLCFVAFMLWNRKN